MEPFTKEYLRKYILETKRTLDTQMDAEWKPCKDSLKEYVRQNLRDAHPMSIHILTEKIKKHITNVITVQLNHQRTLHLGPFEVEFLEGGRGFTLERWRAGIAVPFKIPQQLNILSTISETLETMYGEWRRTYFPAAVFTCKLGINGDCFTPMLQFQPDDGIKSPSIPDIPDLLDVSGSNATPKPQEVDLLGIHTGGTIDPFA